MYIVCNGGNMPLLQVRDFPADIYEEISFEAKRQNRTIAQQTIVLIKKGLGEEISLKEQRRRLLERINSRDIPEIVKAIDPVKFIREDRDR
jgi:antitoxin FitA